MAETDVIDSILPVTPPGTVTDINELPDWLRTPSILNPLTSEELLARMDTYGISQSIIPARKYGPYWGVPYEITRDFVAEAPTRLFATAGICPLSKGEGVRRFDEAVRDFGFIGAHAYTSWSNLRIDDRLWYPYYAKAEELQVPFQIEVMGGKTRPSHGRPEYLDQVAFDFPDLKIVATHVGYPWERDLVGMAEFRENVYIGYDAVMPDRWTQDIIDFAKNEGLAGYLFSRTDTMSKGTSGRSVFGTNYLSMEIDKIWDQVDALGFTDEQKKGMYTDNARALWKLPTPVLS